MHISGIAHAVPVIPADSDTREEPLRTARSQSEALLGEGPGPEQQTQEGESCRQPGEQGQRQSVWQHRASPQEQCDGVSDWQLRHSRAVFGRTGSLSSVLAFLHCSSHDHGYIQKLPATSSPQDTLLAPVSISTPLGFSKTAERREKTTGNDCPWWSRGAAYPL